MGGWGPGNFENDLAMDWYLNDFGKTMIARLREIANDREKIEPDEPESVEFICSLQVLTVLDEHVCPILPSKSEIAQWKQQFLEVFDGFEPSRGEQRRARIVETFDAAIHRGEPSSTSSAKTTPLDAEGEAPKGSNALKARGDAAASGRERRTKKQSAVRKPRKKGSRGP